MHNLQRKPISRSTRASEPPLLNRLNKTDHSGIYNCGYMNPFDLAILSFLNRFAHRSPTFDEAVLLVSGNTLAQGRSGSRNHRVDLISARR